MCINFMNSVCSSARLPRSSIAERLPRPGRRAPRGPSESSNAVFQSVAASLPPEWLQSPHLLNPCMMLSLETFLPRRRFSFVRLWHILFFRSALCFLPQALIWVCTAGPTPTLRSRPSAPTEVVCLPPRTSAPSLSPAPPLLGAGGGLGTRQRGRGQLATGRGVIACSRRLGLRGGFTCQQVSRMRVKEGGAAHQGPERFRVYTWLS